MEGEPALDLRGDAIGEDGVRTVASFDLSRGGTLELAFRMPLTRRDRQQISVCLYAGPGGTDGGAMVAGASARSTATEFVCFGYPAGELTAHDSTAFHFSSKVPTGRHRRPETFPTNGWTHVAIVLAPDGQARLLLNGEEAARLPVPAAMEPGARWYVDLMGRAADTQLLVRDLVLWEGMRY